MTRLTPDDPAAGAPFAAANNVLPRSRPLLFIPFLPPKRLVLGLKWALTGREGRIGIELPDKVGNVIVLTETLLQITHSVLGYY